MEMDKNFHDTNGEYVEAVHYSLEGHEDKKKFKVTRNIGTDEHLKKAINSHSSFNSLRVGSPQRIMSNRKRSPNSPLTRYEKQINLLIILTCITQILSYQIWSAVTFIIILP